MKNSITKEQWKQRALKAERFMKTYAGFGCTHESRECFGCGEYLHPYFICRHCGCNGYEFEKFVYWVYQELDEEAEYKHQLEDEESRSY